MAGSESERIRYRELIHYQLLSNALIMLDRVWDMQKDEQLAKDERLEAVAQYLLRDTIFGQALSWAETRGKLTLRRIPPMSLPI
jgi:hypothetical protein